MCIKMLSFSTYPNKQEDFLSQISIFDLSKIGSRENRQSIYHLGFSKRDQTVFTTSNKVFSILLKFLVFSLFDICLIFGRNSLSLLQF